MVRRKYKQVVRIHINELRVLRAPHTREALDVLPELARRDVECAKAAYEAIAQVAHRGWVDVLLELEQSARRLGVQDWWARTLYACVRAEDGEARADLQRAADADVWRALRRVGFVTRRYIGSARATG